VTTKRAKASTKTSTQESPQAGEPMVIKLLTRSGEVVRETWLPPGAPDGVEVVVYAERIFARHTPTEYVEALVWWISPNTEPAPGLPASAEGA